MIWKDLAAWLKGGFIGLGIIILIFIVSVLLGLPDPFKGEYSMFLFLMASLPFVRVFGFFENLFHNLTWPYDWIFPFVIYILVTFLAYFLIGAFIGFIIGKIKSRK